jgi:hypothetical protein
LLIVAYIVLSLQADKNLGYAHYGGNGAHACSKKTTAKSPLATDADKPYLAGTLDAEKLVSELSKRGHLATAATKTGRVRGSGGQRHNR